MTSMLAKVFDESPDGIIVHDGEHILDVNAAVLRLVGAAQRDDVIGWPIGRLLEYPHLKWVERQLTSGTPPPEPSLFVPERLYALDGSIREVEAHAQMIVLDDGQPAVCMWVHDVRAHHTAAHKVLEELRQQYAAEARAVATRIAGGVAHTINNRLQIVRGFTEFLGDGPLTHEQRLDVDEIIRATDEAADITRQLMQFAGVLPQVREPVHIDALARVALQELGAQDSDLLGRISVVTEAVDAVLIDPRQLRELLTALVSNARAATRAGGRIVVFVAGTTLPTPRRSTDGRRIDRGRYITLEVRDTGTGVHSADQMQMFTPFFTTSPVGEGNGLGLAVVEGLLRQNGAFLTFSSTPGAGSTFVCWFRVGDNPPLVGEAAPASVPHAEPRPVILVDDTDGAHATAVRGLEDLGNRVLLVRSEAELFEVVRHVGPPALVVMSAGIHRKAPRLSRRWRAQWPGVPMLILDGAPTLPPHGTEASRPDPRGIHWLAPPISEHTLINRVQALLEERGAAELTTS